MAQQEAHTRPYPHPQHSKKKGESGECFGEERSKVILPIFIPSHHEEN